MRVDAHQHFWRYSADEYGWIDETMTPLRRDFLPLELSREMARVNFAASVAVQARQTLGETRWLLSLAEANPSIAGIVGWVDLQSGAERTRAQLKALAHPKLVGIRHIVQSEPDDRFLVRPEVLEGLAVLAEFELAFDILIYRRHLPVAAECVARFPQLRFVLDHLAKPNIRDGDLEPWARELRALAQYPNVMAKLSGLVTEADWHAWTPAQIRSYIDVAIDAFGWQRLMIGSDWPVCLVAGDYERTMTVVLDAVNARPAHERDAILGGNAIRFWRLNIDDAQNARDGGAAAVLRGGV